MGLSDAEFCGVAIMGTELNVILGVFSLGKAVSKGNTVGVEVLTFESSESSSPKNALISGSVTPAKMAITAIKIAMVDDDSLTFSRNNAPRVD